MKRVIAACVCVCVVCMGTAGWAQGETATTRELDMDALDVDGAQLSQGAGFTAEQRGKTSSLIQIRQDFIPELVRSVEEL